MNNPIKLRKKRRKLIKKLNKLYNNIIICTEDLKKSTTAYEIKYFTMQIVYNRIQDIGGNK